MGLENIPKRRNTLSVISLLIGLAAVLYIPIFGIYRTDPVNVYPGGYIVVLLGICAAVLGLVSWSQIRKNPGTETGKGFAAAGLILGAAAVAVVALQVFFVGPAVIRIQQEILNNTAP